VLVALRTKLVFIRSDAIATSTVEASLIPGRARRCRAVVRRTAEGGRHPARREERHKRDHHGEAGRRPRSGDEAAPRRDRADSTTRPLIGRPLRHGGGGSTGPAPLGHLRVKGAVRRFPRLGLRGPSPETPPRSSAGGVPQILGTNVGPHVMAGGPRPARLSRRSPCPQRVDVQKRLN
jgi:hypothetical protein